MIVSLAFCPHPPLLVPELAAGAAPELDGLRSACDAVLAEALSAEPEVVVVLGTGPVGATYPPQAVGTMRGYGVPVDVPLIPTESPEGTDVLLIMRSRSTLSTTDAVDPMIRSTSVPVLPLSLTVGAWLLDRSGWAGRREATAVEHDAMIGKGRRQEVAEGVRARPERVALLVMADGSNSRTEKAPGGLRPGAAAYDSSVAAVLADGDPSAGLRVSYHDAVEVGSAGWSAWRTAWHAAAPGPWRAHLAYDQAPYGVGYLAASWRV